MHRHQLLPVGLDVVHVSWVQVCVHVMGSSIEDPRVHLQFAIEQQMMDFHEQNPHLKHYKVPVAFYRQREQQQARVFKSEPGPQQFLVNQMHIPMIHLYKSFEYTPMIHLYKGSRVH